MAFGVALLSLAASGCGGKSDASSSIGKNPSTAAETGQTSAPVSAESEQPFIAQADAICHTSNVRLAHAKAKGEKTAELVAGVIANEAIERKALAELGGLRPPPTLASVWKSILGDRRGLANGLGSLAAATEREDQAALPALEKQKEILHADLTKVASAAGFKDCSKIG
jgi:hypothetical protein